MKLMKDPWINARDMIVRNWIVAGALCLPVLTAPALAVDLTAGSVSTEAQVKGPAQYFERLARIALKGDRDAAGSAGKAALLTAISRDVPGILAVLRKADDGSLSQPHRQAALWILAEFGRPGDVPLALSLAQPDGGQPPPILQRELEEAMVQVLTREPDATRKLSTRLRGAKPGALAPVSIALGRTGGASSMGVLRDMMRQYPELGSVILPQVRRVLKTLPAQDDSGLRAEVRSFLESTDLQAMRAATGLVADLEDDDAFPRLLEMLDYEGTPAYGGVLSALNRLAGQDLGRDPQQWQGWYAKEQAWWLQKAPELLQQLDEVAAAKAMPALTELGRHRLFRRALTESIAQALEYPDPRMRTAACETLTHLGSRLAAEHILVVLEDDDPKVAEAAWIALKRLTGLDLPAETEAWIAALASSGRAR